MPPPCSFQKGELAVHKNNRNLAKSPGLCCYRSRQLPNATENHSRNYRLGDFRDRLVMTPNTKET